MWLLIARFILRNKAFILIFLGILTAFMGYESTKVQMSYEYANMLPKDDTVYLQYEQFKAKFGVEANVFLIAFQDSNFFEAQKINDFKAITQQIKGDSGIAGILSLPDLYYMAKDTTKKQFQLLSLFPDTIVSQEILDSLKTVALNQLFYKDILYNDTANVFAVAITFDKKVVDSKKRIDLVNQIKNDFDLFGKKYHITPHYSGLPYIRTAVSEKIKHDMQFFIILALLITLLILYLFFRSFRILFIAIIVVGISVIWVLGTMALFDYKITILTAMLPPLLIVIGIPNIIYLLNHYFDEIRHHGNKIKSLHRTIYKTGNAIFLTNLTTASGFGTFIITNSQVLQEFGLVALINIIGLFFLSISIIPIFYSFFALPKKKHIKHLESKSSSWFLAYLTYLITTKRTIIYITVGIIGLLAFWGISKIQVVGYMVDDIPHDDEIYVDLKFFEQYFKGALPLEIMVDTKKKKGLFRLKNIKRIDKLQTALEELPALSRPISYVELVKYAKQSYYNGNPRKYAIPSKMEKNFILSYASKAHDSGNRIKTFIDSNKQCARISIQMADIGTHKMGNLIGQVQSKLDTIFPPEKYTTMVTGMSVVFEKGMRYLIKNLTTSVLLAIAIIALFMSLLFGSFRMVVISLIPNMIPLLLTAGMMGFWGIPLKPSTILVFSIAFGIAVDDTIHFLSRYRLELKQSEWDIGVAVHNALDHVGISMLHTSIILFFGFIIFTLSGFDGIVYLGLLVSITLFIAMLANLIILPSLLLSFEHYITTKAFAEPMLSIFNEDEDVDFDDL
jgi:predicted RND superfamily exporter protein